ncbi:hypothetical protein Pfo_020387 [Paulownia fortunei]|nr:hypothetical protein Pfo_020387 [Paulownia fortunei]
MKAPTNSLSNFPPLENTKPNLNPKPPDLILPKPPKITSIRSFTILAWAILEHPDVQDVRASKKYFRELHGHVYGVHSSHRRSSGAKLKKIYSGVWEREKCLSGWINRWKREYLHI